MQTDGTEETDVAPAVDNNGRAYAVLGVLAQIPFDAKLYGKTVAALCGLSILLLAFSALSINSQNAILSSDNHFTAPLNGRAALMPQGKRDIEKAQAEEAAKEQAEAAEEELALAASKITDVAPELHEETAYGSLPVRGPEGKTVFQTYSAEQVMLPISGAPRVALVFTQFGMSEKLSAEAVAELPKGSTLILSPYASGDVPAMVKAARVRGHEVWLEVPLPYEDTSLMVDTGPLTLQEKLDENANRKRLLTAMGTSTGYVGLYVSNAPSMLESVMFKNVVAGTAMDRGVALAIAATPAQMAGGAGVVTGVQPIAIDSLSTPQSVLASLRGKLQAAQNSKAQIYSLPLNRLSIRAARALVEDMLAQKSGSYTPLSGVVPRDSDTPAKAEAVAETKPEAAPPQDMLTE